jgi:hypothetical protein
MQVPKTHVPLNFNLHNLKGCMDSVVSCVNDANECRTAKVVKPGQSTLQSGGCAQRHSRDSGYVSRSRMRARSRGMCSFKTRMTSRACHGAPHHKTSHHRGPVIPVKATAGSRWREGAMDGVLGPLYLLLGVLGGLHSDVCIAHCTLNDGHLVTKPGTQGYPQSIPTHSAALTTAAAQS